MDPSQLTNFQIFQDPLANKSYCTVILPMMLCFQPQNLCNILVYHLESRRLATPISLGLSWLLTNRHRTWELLAIYEVTTVYLIHSCFTWGGCKYIFGKGWLTKNSRLFFLKLRFFSCNGLVFSPFFESSLNNFNFQKTNPGMSVCPKSPVMS